MPAGALTIYIDMSYGAHWPLPNGNPNPTLLGVSTVGHRVALMHQNQGGILKGTLKRILEGIRMQPCRPLKGTLTGTLKGTLEGTLVYNPADPLIPPKEPLRDP